MRSIAYFLLLLCIVVGSIGISRNSAGRYELLQDTITAVVRLPQLQGKMTWERGGVSMATIVDHLYMRAPSLEYLYSDRGLRIQIGGLLNELLGGEVFSLKVGENGKTVRKYFVGEKPDLQDIVAEVLARPEIIAKLHPDTGDGMLLEDIVAAVDNRYPSVRTLYENASTRVTDFGFRTAIGKTLADELDDVYFSLRVVVDGKLARKYFYGVAPDMATAALNVIDNTNLANKMMIANGGASMDEIIAEFAKHYPEIYDLYLRVSPNNSDQGFRIALSRLMAEEIGVFNLVTAAADGKLVRRFYVGELPSMDEVIAELLADRDIAAKMERKNGGVSMNDIVAKVVERYSEVYYAYLHASTNNNDQGLRVALGVALAHNSRTYSRIGNTGYTRYLWKEQSDATE